MAAKEVARYSQALRVGCEAVQESGLITVRQILTIQEVLEQNNAGFRKQLGTTLKDNEGNVVYTPPQDYNSIVSHMSDLEQFMNAPKLFDADPLIKMALIHHQFESIHPFYDGNGRTGRILAVLFLVLSKLLDIPVLCMSRYIVRTKDEYYRRLQDVRDNDAWESWVMYMLHAIDMTSLEAITTIYKIKLALTQVKVQIRDHYKFYSQDLINNLFTYPYTKIEFVERDLAVSRVTATRYLDTLTAGGLLAKHKIGHTNYYVNLALNEVLTAPPMQ